MSDSPQPNPSQDPSSADPPTGDVGGTKQANPFTEVNAFTPSPNMSLAARRPGGLTAVCIIAIVLGVLGTLAGATKGLNVIFGAQMQQAFGSMGAAGNPEMQKVQEEMHAAMAAEMERFQLANGIVCIAQLALCIALIYAGVKALGLKDAGRKLLLWSCALLLVFEIGRLVVDVYMQLSISPIMELYMPRMMKGPNGEDIGGENFGKIIARMSLVVGIVSLVGWTLVKLAFYGIATHYLRKPKIVALFDTNPKSDTLEPSAT